MSDQVWYTYHQDKQLGPFTHQQLLQLFHTKMITHSAFVFKVGWKDWVPLGEVADELGIEAQKPESSEEPARPPRASIQGRIIVHNNGQLVLGSGINISATGIFVETPKEIFQLGEELKLTCRVDGISKAFNALAKVIRFNKDTKFPIGYGLRFVELDEGVASKIEELIRKLDMVQAK